MVAMTHDELLDIIGHWNWIEPGAINALRAVVELHKPSDGQCYECHYEGRDYPCHTIQAIEKELS
jgi:hypothetical protein